MWSFIHVMYLVGWGNRIGTMYSWARAMYFGHNRAHRIISFREQSYELARERRRAGAPTPIEMGTAAEPAAASIGVGSQPLPPGTQEARAPAAEVRERA